MIQLIKINIYKNQSFKEKISVSSKKIFYTSIIECIYITAVSLLTLNYLICFIKIL